MKAFVLLLVCLASSASLANSSEVLRSSDKESATSRNDERYITTTPPPAETTTLNSCPEPFESIGKQCLLVDNFTKGTYLGMKQFCEMFKGRVAKVPNGEALRAISNYLYNNDLTTVSLWIGATDEEEEGVWKWEDVTPVLMGTPLWANYGCSNKQAPDGGTSENCVLLDKGLHFYLNDARCDTAAGVICEVVV